MGASGWPFLSKRTANVGFELKWGCASRLDSTTHCIPNERCMAICRADLGNEPKKKIEEPWQVDGTDCEIQESEQANGSELKP
jgi:hypothetical protein